jgi:hypothetical protein
MMGRDFAAMGTEDGVKTKYGDGGGYPYPGPVRMRFIDRNTFLVVDSNKTLSVQNLAGKVLGNVSPESTRPIVVADDLDDENEDQDEYAAFQKYPSTVITTNENYLDMEAVDAVPIPHTNNLAVCDGLNDRVVLMNKREFTIEDTIGKQGFQTMEFSGISGIDCFQLGDDVVYCVSEMKNHRIQMFTYNPVSDCDIENNNDFETSIDIGKESDNQDEGNKQGNGEEKENGILEGNGNDSGHGNKKAARHRTSEDFEGGNGRPRDDEDDDDDSNCNDDENGSNFHNKNYKHIVTYGKPIPGM